jgi:GTP-binding protein Era
MNDIEPKDFVCGYVAVAGRPNVGKSTLVNNLLNFPLSIVTAKPQTTRHKILGILSEDHYQAIFLDIPGIMVPKYALQDLMVKAAWSAIEEADLVLLMVEPRLSEVEHNTGVLRRIEGLKKKVIVAINKVDLVRKLDLLPIIDAYSNAFTLKAIVPISAIEADGLDRLKQEVVSSLPHQPPFYPPGELTDRPQRFFVGEIIRQKVLQQFSEEIPYAVAVVIEEYKEREGAKDYIEATLVCERDSQKGILIGEAGDAVKRIGQAAREAIEAFIGKGVYLKLKVDVRKDWRKQERTIRRLDQT